MKRRQHGDRDEGFAGINFLKKRFVDIAADTTASGSERLDAAFASLFLNAGKAEKDKALLCLVLRLSKGRLGALIDSIEPERKEKLRDNEEKPENLVEVAAKIFTKALGGDNVSSGTSGSGEVREGVE